MSQLPKIFFIWAAMYITRNILTIIRYQMNSELLHFKQILWVLYWPNEVIDDILMMTSSNGNIFRVTGPLCGEFTGLGEFPTQRPVTRSFDVFFDMRSNKRLSKQSWGWWFEMPSLSLWRHRNVVDGLGDGKTNLGMERDQQRRKYIFHFYRISVAMAPACVIMNLYLVCNSVSPLEYVWMLTCRIINITFIILLRTYFSKGNYFISWQDF